MHLRFVWVGRTKDLHLAALERVYLQRIGHFARCEVSVVRDLRAASSAAATEKIKDREGETVLRAIADGSHVVLLDEQGKQLTSMELARLISRRQTSSTQELAFIVGGPLGSSGALKRRADMCLSLSRFTLTHEMARLILVEQVYRAFAILRGLPYPK